MEPKFKDKAEYLEWINTDEYKTIGQPVFDSKVNSAIKTYQLKHPDSKLLGERLDDIENRINTKEIELKKNELKFFAYKKCVEFGIDFDLLDGFPLEDEKQIKEKILQLSKTTAITKDRLMNKLLIENSFKPGSGIGHDSPSV